MGNGSSNEKNKSDSPKNEITEVQKKCIKTFTGDASEDVNQFIDQINGVKLIYKLDDDQMLKLALEKIEGRALDWLHENPTVMTHGLNDLLRGLLTQFSKKSSNDDNQHCGPVPPSAPSAPSKIDVCSEEEIQVQPGIYPNMNSIQYQFDQIRLEPPPSYDSILRETVNVFPENFQATAPVIGTAPNLSQTKSEVVDRKSISSNNNKMRQKRRNKKRDTVQSAPVTPIPALMNIKLPENTPKSVDTGTKSKIICDFCKTIGHETNKCLLNASKNAQFKEKTVNGMKCAYCKAEGHLLKDCAIVPPCEKCNEKGHRTKDCSKLKEKSNQNSELEGIVKKQEKPAIICSYCKKEGHNIFECELASHCDHCNKKGHKAKDCRKLQDNSKPNSEREVTVKDVFEPGITCNFCKKEGHQIYECALASHCDHCNKKGHKTENCYQKKKILTETPQTPLDLGYCKHCNAVGHHSVACPKKRLIPAVPLIPKPRCYRCNSEYHRIQQCPFTKAYRKHNENECAIM